MAFTKANKLLFRLSNDTKLWKRLLREDFNYPPLLHGKRKRKQTKKQQKNTSNLKLIYRERFVAAREEDRILIPSLINLLRVRTGSKAGSKVCMHDKNTEYVKLNMHLFVQCRTVNTLTFRSTPLTFPFLDSFQTIRPIQNHFAA